MITVQAIYNGSDYPELVKGQQYKIRLSLSDEDWMYSDLEINGKTYYVAGLSDFLMNFTQINFISKKMNNTEKDFEWFLNQLTDTEREQYMENIDQDTLNEFKQGILHASNYLSGAFKWHFTPQGHDYWVEIEERIFGK